MGTRFPPANARSHECERCTHECVRHKGRHSLMAVTRSTVSSRSTAPGIHAAFSWRTTELLWTLAASLLIAVGFYLVYQAKAPAPSTTPLLNLNTLNAREDLLPSLNTLFPDPAIRDLVARKIYYLSGGLANVGALARIRVTADEVTSGRALKPFRDRLAGHTSIPLLTADQFRQLKPLYIVRTPARFRRTFLLWAGLFFAAFLAAHVFWSLRRFSGDQTLLPAVLLLTGIGFILMVSLRDPLRDNLLFADFAQGVVIGCLLLAALSALDYQNLFGKLSFVPLLVSFALSALLIVFGSGPGTSDAKVNLFGFQPVEIVRILLVFFLAGYFASRWDVLRHARETRASLSALTSRFDIPPVRIHPARGHFRGAVSGIFLSAERHGPGADLRLSLPGAIRRRPRQRLRPSHRPGPRGRRIRRRIRPRRAAYRRRARLHVALAMEQHDSRRRPTGGIALGLRHRRRHRRGHRPGRPASGSRRSY